MLFVMNLFFHPPVTFSHLGPNIFHSTLFSKTLCICSSHNLSDSFSSRYKITCKIMLLNIRVYIFREQKDQLLILFGMRGGILQMLLMSAFATV